MNAAGPGTDGSPPRSEGDEGGTPSPTDPPAPEGSVAAFAEELELAAATRRAWHADLMEVAYRFGPERAQELLELGPAGADEMRRLLEAP